VRALALAVIAAAAALPLLTTNTYYLFVAALIGVTIVVTTGLDILAGLSGQVSLGHAGLYAIGAYSGAILTTRGGWSFWAALPVAVAAGALVGAVLALASLRAVGPYLAMVTIAFGIIVEHGLIEWDALTHGFGGIANIPRPALLRMPLTLPRYYEVVVVAVVLSVALARNLHRSPWGRAIVAVRESEIAAESLGLSAWTVRTVAFTLSAAFAGAGGCLYAFLASFVSPDSFTMQTSILFLLVVLFGGLGRVGGPVVGSIVLIVLPEALQALSDYRLILYGVLLLASIYFLPGGVVGALSRWRRAPGRADTDDAAGDVAPACEVAPPQPLALTATGVDLRFGGLVALAGVDLAVLPGSVHGLIGPNGAGKTSLLNVLSGFYRPSAGLVRLGEAMITSVAPYRASRHGIARTFQTTQLFESMTALENVEVGLRGPATGSPLGALAGLPALGRAERRLRAQARALLAFVNYPGDPEAPASSLPFGHKRLVEIARALARRPAVLLLDEPAAGLSHAEIEQLAVLVRKIRAAGMAVLLVGHHLDLVLRLSDRVSVLDYGRVIAEGRAAAVQRDPAVIEAYLGARHAAPAPATTRRRGESLLDVRRLRAGYGAIEAVRDVSVEVRAGEMVVIVGANGAGKTTMMRTIAGLLAPRAGAICFAGREITGRPAHWIARRGIALVPEGRMVFADQSVRDNLRLGAYGRRGRDVEADIERAYGRFPVLGRRARQPAGTLSGGEQQMLAIARALMRRPSLLLLDEPSLGLAPRLVREVFDALARLRADGLTLLVVEQLAEVALAVADRGYVLERGRMVLAGAAAELARHDEVTRAYLGRADAETSGPP